MVSQRSNDVWGLCPCMERTITRSIPAVPKCFFMCLAVVTIFLGMRVSLDWLWPARAQPFVAILAAPSAYLGFAALTQDSAGGWKKTLLLNGMVVVI